MSAEPARPLDWNGPNGDRWVENQQRLDRMLAPYGEALLTLAAPQPGQRILDVGSGAGATSLDFATHVGSGGRVVGVDISSALVRRARELAEGRRERIKFLLGDAAVARFEAEFDQIVSRFGVMFFDDPVAAFRNLRTGLKPDGRLAFVCWRGAQENDWTRLPMTAIRDLVPPLPAPAPDAPGPFAFAEKARIEAILRDAGYADIDIRPFDAPVLFGAGDTPDAAVQDAVANAVKVGPLERALAGQSDAVRAAALAAVRKAYEQRLTPRGVVIDGAAWLVTARKG